jgi:hypothetical protein
MMWRLKLAELLNTISIRDSCRSAAVPSGQRKPTSVVGRRADTTFAELSQTQGRKVTVAGCASGKVDC